MTSGPEEPATTDPREAAAATYFRRTLLWGGYVRWFPLVAVVYFATFFLGNARREYPVAIAVAGALLFPAGVAYWVRRARPAGLGRPGPSAWNGVARFLFAIALLTDLALVGRVLWDPPCRARNALWMGAGVVGRWGALSLAVALLVLAWIGRIALARKRQPAAPQLPRIALLQRIFAFAAIQQMLVLWAFALPPLMLAPAGTDDPHGESAKEAANLAANAQEQYHASHGRYADRLEDLVAVDKGVAADRAITFRFGYAGDTRFAFTAVHPKACEPAVRGR